MPVKACQKNIAQVKTSGGLQNLSELVCIAGCKHNLLGTSCGGGHFARLVYHWKDALDVSDVAPAT